MWDICFSCRRLNGFCFFVKRSSNVGYLHFHSNHANATASFEVYFTDRLPSQSESSEGGLAHILSSENRVVCDFLSFFPAKGDRFILFKARETVSWDVPQKEGLLVYLLARHTGQPYTRGGPATSPQHMYTPHMTPNHTYYGLWVWYTHKDRSFF